MDVFFRATLGYSLADFLLGALIRGGTLLAIAWLVLPWKHEEFRPVFLWAAIALLAGALAEMLLLSKGLPPLAVAVGQTAVELVVLFLMVLWRKRGLDAALTLLPAYAVAIAVVDLLLLD